MFQSVPLREGRFDPVAVIDAAIMVSIRAPAGGAIVLVSDPKGELEVSIRAPAGGAIAARKLASPAGCLVSIRAPAGGAILLTT